MRLLVLLAALGSASASAAQDGDFHLSRGGSYFSAINGVLGVGVGIGAFLIPQGFSTRDKDWATGGAAGAGFLALFLGGGLTAAHLTDPSPPMAWHATFAGLTGALAAVNLVAALGITGAYPTLLTFTGGYCAAAILDLALPKADAFSWSGFWVSMLATVVPETILGLVGLVSRLGGPTFTALMLAFPLVGMVLSRLALAFADPFDPWEEDEPKPKLPPVRPYVTAGPSGATVGFAVIW
jgi:hypothetical protein